jgi:DNA-directed RNA polymerase subunit RPC12/RpoP
MDLKRLSGPPQVIVRGRDALRRTIRLTTKQTEALDDEDPEVPFVCTDCTRIFRARVKALEGTRVRCGNCGAQRSGDSLLRALPSYLRRLVARPAP